MTKHKNQYAYIALFIYAIYIIIGNLGRIIPTPFFSSNISILELGIYLIVAAIILFKAKYYYNLVKNNKNIFILALVILFFSILGLIYHNGESISSFIYSIRLIIQIISIFVFGDIFNKIFGKDVMKLIDFILIIFMMYTVIGWIIYFNFPNSSELWIVLDKYNITVAGDPHIRRFMGGFLDPNFTSNIIILPIILCIYKYFHSENKKYLYLVMGDYFFLCMIYTYSRSGLLGLFISVGVICLLNVKNIVKNIKSNFKMLVPIIASLVILFTLLNLPVIQQLNKGIVDQGQIEETQKEGIQETEKDLTAIDRFSGRFVNMGSDASALHRVEDFVVGISFLTQSTYTFLFGIGYNYVQYDLDTYLTALDSSVLNTIISFGFIGTILILFISSTIMKKIVRNVKTHNKKIENYLIAYLISSIIISNLNNLLYYQYYIILFGSFLMYFYLFNEYNVKE